MYLTDGVFQFVDEQSVAIFKAKEVWVIQHLLFAHCVVLHSVHTIQLFPSELLSFGLTLHK